MDALSLCVMMSSVDTLTEHQLLCEYYLTAEKLLHDVASTCYKMSALAVQTF